MSAPSSTIAPRAVLIRKLVGFISAIRRRDRLLLEDIERCSRNYTLMQSLDERTFIDDRAAGRVDQKAGGLHQCNPPPRSALVGRHRALLPQLHVDAEPR